MILFLLSCLELLSSLHPTVCVFIDLLNGFLFKVLEHLFDRYLKSLSCVSAKLCFSVPTVVGWLGSDGGILINIDCVSGLVFRNLIWGCL